MKPYLDIGVFKELKDINLFKTVQPFLGSIQWKNGQDLCPDTLYMDSVKEGEPPPAQGRGHDGTTHKPSAQAGNHEATRT